MKKNKRKNKMKRLLSLVLAIVMICCCVPFASYASEDTDSTQDCTEWQAFLSNLVVLEGYADSYVAENTDENAIKLVINYIRTGVDRYNTDSWETIAGEANTSFISYVAEQDEANATTASDLRSLDDAITITNGDEMDIGHLFGCLNVSSNNSYNQNYVDFGSWLGDICDLMECANYYGVEATDIEDMVTEITENFFLDNYLTYSGHVTGATSGFGLDDFRADMDCLYIVNQITSGAESLSGIFEEYYTADLTDADRASYFLNNRFAGSTTQDAVRSSIYTTYSQHVLAQMLEADKGFTDVDDIRTACCYVLADYLFELADGTLVEPDDSGSDDDTDTDDTEDSSLYSVFSSNTTTLAPGITQTVNYALNSSDSQIVYYYSCIDLSRDDVSIYANYNDNDPSEGWAMSRVSSQMEAAEEKHSDPTDTENYIENYSSIVGINASGYNMSTGQPSGLLVMEGVTYNADNGKYPFFAILNDGTPVIAKAGEYSTYQDEIAEAVQGFGSDAILIYDGVNQHSSTETSVGPRTAVGITEDGQVVMIVLDGRQSPFSAGSTYYELAEIMLDIGCVYAMALDGGGSTTFDAKQEGSDEITVVNSPSDGYERSVSSSLLVVSTAENSDEFDHALITTDTDYLTLNSTVDITVTGVSSTGNSAEIPEGAYLQVSDTSLGSIDGTTYTALARGTVEIQLVVDGEVVGSKTVYNIRRPDTLTFTQSSINAVYGVAEELPLEATYDGNPVAINYDDITFTFSTSTAGTMDGFSFIGDESSGVRKVTVTAAVTTNLTIEASMVVCLYSSDESIFDFDTAMYGDESLAWNREVSNTVTLDNTTYYTIDASEDTTASYTYALDIQSIEAPERLAPLMTYLSGFAGTSGDATPWDYLLALAARVNTQTNVTISVNIPEGVDVDISGLNVVNDYFTLTSAEFDESTRTLTVICNWVKQTGAIDPDTANSICILSGITLTPNEDAVVDENNCVTIGMSGTVSYDIYLRSGQLYSLASDESNQEAYGIYPYYDPDDSAGYYGGHFYDTYITFSDSFNVCSDALNGWVAVEDQLYYYVDNEYLTGVQCLPGYDDADTEYYYNFDSNGVCLGKITGLFEYQGDKYYAVNGELKVSWRIIDGNYYYFSRTDYKAVDGEQTISGYDYVFEDYILVQGDWLEDDNGTMYVWAGTKMCNRWFTVDGNQYFAYSDYYIATGIAKTLNHERTAEAYYIFDENGVWLENQNGLYDYEGETYLTENGELVHYPGLVYLDGYYYYFNSSNAAVKDCSYAISRTNDLLPQGTYTFDADGKMLYYDGIVKETDDTWYYYENNVKTYAGLIEIDGDYYYVRSNFQVVHDATYYVSKTNDLMDAGYYTFDSEGKMVTDTEELLQGIVKETEDIWYYYVDGVKTYAGLIEIDGDYYYVRSNFEVVHDATYYVSKTNGLMDQAYYTFDSEGKMVTDTEDLLQGIVQETEDTWYYYVNGVKTYAGLIEIDGYYYYVRSNFEVVHDATYYISKSNGLMDQGYYTFDSEGKMVTDTEELLNGIVKETEDTWYYYVDGVKTYAGLIEIDGYYYYVRSNFEVVHDATYYISKSNGLMDQGYYTFDSEGKMVTDTEELLQGIVKETEDTWYYYVDGVKTYAGLIEIDGDYYYVRSNFEVVHDATYYISKSNGLMDQGYYTFDEDGKMVIS